MSREVLHISSIGDLHNYINCSHTFKSTDNLFNEIINNETKLVIDTDTNGKKELKRVIRVLCIYLIKDGKVLMEVEQKLFNNDSYKIRSRMCVVCEKMYETESIDDAISRALNEELGLNIMNIPYDLLSYIETKHSDTFGIMTEYHTESVFISVADQAFSSITSSEEFEFTEYFKDTKNPRICARWRWMTPDNIKDLRDDVLDMITKKSL